MKTILFSLFLAAVASATTTSVYQIWQPISLVGTDVYGVAGVESAYDGAAVLPRPVVISGAIPEDLVAVIALNSPLMATANGYDEAKVNLLSMCNIQLRGDVEKGKLLIRFDISAAKVPEKLELSLVNVLELGVEAVRKTVEFNGKAQAEQSFICRVEIEGAKEGSDESKLAGEFVVEGPKGE